MIELKHLSKVYENVTPLKDVSTVINDGDIISIIGPSGTGKSTLIRCINMLETPTSGQIIFNGTDITDPKCDLTKIRQKMGMVFQSFNLFNHLTVIENLMFPQTQILKKSRQEAYEKSVELLKRVGLSDKELNYPDQLSGGQKQRVAIARTLSMDPEVILFDEPTSALDPTMVGEVQAVIKDLAKSGKTMMIVTHEMNFAKEIANRVFYMDRGGIYEDGTPDQIFNNPKKKYTLEFIRKIKTLELFIENDKFDFFDARNQIDQYCARNDISRKTKYRLLLCFEELIVQELISVLKDRSIKVVIEYSPVINSFEMTITYGGHKFDPKVDGNDFSYRFLKTLVSDLSYEYHPKAKKSNIIKVIFNEDTNNKK